MRDWIYNLALAGLLLVCTMASAQAASAKTPAPLANAGKTPAETLTNLAKAILAKNADRFVGCYDVPAGQRPLFATMGRFGVLSYEVHQKMAKAYGDSGALLFSAGSDLPGLIGNYTKVKVAITGNNAVGNVPGVAKPYVFRKRDGRWGLVISQLEVADKVRVQNLTFLLAGFSEAMIEVRGLVGQKGQSPAALKALFQKRAEALVQTLTAQDRARQELARGKSVQPSPKTEPAAPNVDPAVPVRVAAPAIPGGAGKTPRATMVNLAAAIRTGNDQAIRNCFALFPHEKPILDVMVKLLKISHTFGNKLEVIYGKEGVAKFDGESPMGNPGRNLNRMKIRIRDNWAEVDILTAGAKLFKVGTTWRVCGTPMPASRVQGYVEPLEIKCKVLKQILPEIGKQGSTAKSIERKVAEAYAKLRREAQAKSAAAENEEKAIKTSPNE